MRKHGIYVKKSTNKMKSKCCLAVQSTDMTRRSRLSAVARSVNLDIYTFTQEGNGGMLSPAVPLLMLGLVGGISAQAVAAVVTELRLNR